MNLSQGEVFDRVVVGLCLGCAHSCAFINMPSGESACGLCKRNLLREYDIKEIKLPEGKLTDNYISLDMMVLMNKECIELNKLKKQIINIPHSEYHASRYDTDNEHIIHLYAGDESFDVRIEKKEANK